MYSPYVSLYLLFFVAATSHGYEVSKEREACVVNEAMDSSIFPPDKYPDSAIRLAFRGVPVVGDLHLHIRDIDVEDIQLKVSISRKSDTSFTFKVTGTKDGEKAHLRAFLREVDFATPREKWATNTAKGVSEFEQGWTAFTNTVTFGLTDRKGNLTQMPASFDFTMSADFSLDRNGEWSLIRGSEKQELEFDFGNGGALMALVKLILKGVGTVDEMFRNILWPIVKMFIPPNIGQAFQAVPYKDGEISTSVEVKGKCNKRAHGHHGCATDDLDLSLLLGFTLSAHLEPIIRAMANNKKLKDEFYQSIVQNMKEQFDQGASITGAGHFGSSFEMLANHAVTASVSPNLELPMAVLSALVGKDILISDFLPKTNALALKVGQFGLNAGRLTVNQFSFGGLRLPIGEEAISIDTVVLEEATIEMEDVPEDAEKAKAFGIFDPKCPISLTTHGVNVGLTRKDGLKMGIEGANSSVSTTVDRKLVNDQLDGVGKKLQVPRNVRTEQPLTAIGEPDPPSSYYETIDGKHCDRAIVDACREAVAGQGDGRVSVEDAQKIFEKVADGGKETAVERWTMRYCMTQFKWTEAAHDWIIDECKKITQEDKPEESPSKRAKTGTSYYETIDGMKCDRGIVDTCRQAVEGQGDGRVSQEDAEKVWAQAADGNKVTNAEKWTLRYCLTSFRFTRAGHDFIMEKFGAL